MPSWSRTAKEAAKQYALVRAALRVRQSVRRLAPFAPNGHFYSPVPDVAEVERDAARIFARTTEVAGVDLRADAQLALLNDLAPLAADLPWRAQRTSGLRYFYENGAFTYGDGSVYGALLRRLQPRRVVEVGAGSTTCLLLDARERWFPSCDVVTIEPYPALLQSLWSTGDARAVTLLPIRLQDAPLDVFDALEAGDVLFVDSSHVSKVGSDVNSLFFEVLPRLRSGVFVHLHDVFFPFEYPRAWVEEGRAWNEAYLLRAFLQFNSDFEIVLFNSYLGSCHRDALLHAFPLAAQDAGGSIWLRRT